MLRARSSFAILAVFTLAIAVHAQPADRVDALVRKLGSESFVQREKARKELITIGPSTLDALRRGVKSAEPETGRRIADLIAHFEEQLLTQKILTPKMIDLKLEGVSVQDAIADIAKKSGYPVQFLGDATPFAKKKITLTGKMAFWEAVDQLCEQAGLMEQPIESVPMVNPYYSRRPNPYLVQPQPMQAGPIKLTVRSGKEPISCRAGSIKTEAHAIRDAKTKSLIVTLTAGLEPSLHNGQIVGRPALTKLLDEGGRKLEVSFEPPPPSNDPAGMQWVDFNAMVGPGPTRVATMRVKDDGSKSIAELAGSLTMQVDLQNVVLARMEKIMDAASKSVAGSNGGSLKIQSIKKHAYNTIEVQVTMENLTPNPLGNVFIGGGNVIIRGNVVINGGNIRVNGNGNARDIPDLLDAKGQKFRVNSVTNDSFNINNGNASRNVTILYQAVGDQEPRDLVLFGSRTHIIGVPFRFENVPVR